MSERKNNTLKYFIYSIKEYFDDSFSKLDNRKFESIRYLLNDYLDLYELIQKNPLGKDKLQNALNALLENILFHLHKTPLKKHKLFQEDINNLIELLNNNKQEKKVYYFLSAFNKKIDKNNILNIWIDILVNSINDYEDVDILSDCYISELLYEEYSLEFLGEWWLKSFSVEEMKKDIMLSVHVLKFKELAQHRKKDYQVLLALTLPNKLEKELEEKKEIKIGNVNYKIAEVRRGELEGLQVGKKDSIVETSVKAVDKYKAIDNATYNLENYIQVYRALETTLPTNCCKACIVIEPDENPVSKRLAGRNGNIRILTLREKEDIEDFIFLRDRLRMERNSIDNIANIENVVNIIQQLPEFTKENRLLNLWGCIEDLVRYYESPSIIQRVQEIVPKILVMYFLKQKFNNLWERLLPLIKANDEELIEVCRKSNPKKYDKEKFLQYLLDEKSSLRLYKKTKNNIVTQRMVLEIHDLLKCSKYLERQVELYFTSIRHSINTVYRVRNNLIHNGGKVSTIAEFQTRKLQGYLNSILGTLIYHINSNPEISIVEILYSIDMTYLIYSSKVKNIQAILKKFKDKEDELKKEVDKKDEVIECQEKLVTELIEANIMEIVFINYLFI